MLRVVLDANVVVSGWIQALGPSATLLEAAAEGRIRVVVSPAIIDEYRRSLAYPKVVRRLRVGRDVIDAWIDALVLGAIVVAGESPLAVVRDDPDDDAYLAAALEGQAAFVVSGDHHLLDLGAHGGVRIVRPRQVLEILAVDGEP